MAVAVAVSEGAEGRGRSASVRGMAEYGTRPGPGA